MFELDHILIGVTDAESAEVALRTFGMTFSVHREHRGQGTRNACAVFENAFLELLYQGDKSEILSELVAPLGLYERINWKSSGACPFGFCFRAIEGSSGKLDPKTLPFETWPYEAAYLPTGMSIPIVTPQRSFDEPLIFIGTWGTSPRTWEENAGGLPLHCGRQRKLTHFRMQVPPVQSALSSGFRWFVEHGLLPSPVASASPHLELHWDDGECGESASFQPTLPMSICW